MRNHNCIEHFSVSRLKKPLNQPFRIATGQHDYLDNLIFKIKLTDGTTGRGEAAIATHITGETIDETKISLEKAGRKIIGESPYDYLKMSSWLNEELIKNKSAVGAVESALADALTKLLDMPLWHFFGDQCDQLSTDITIVIADLKETEDSVKKYFKLGFRIFKVKVGRDMDLDIKRVMAVKRLAPKSKIYLDANQG
jgi:L-Ala-D/L-Glu epimerase